MRFSIYHLSFFIFHVQDNVEWEWPMKMTNVRWKIPSFALRLNAMLALTATYPNRK